MDAVTLERVTKRFGDDFALADVSIAVREATILDHRTIGAGKTTLVRLMTGALAPTVGEVRVLGEDPLQFKRATRERIGYMPQTFALYPDLDSRERGLRRIAFRGCCGGGAAGAPARCWRPSTSGRSGTAARAGCPAACRRSSSPQRWCTTAIMFLDEPTAGIDPLLRATVWQELTRLRDEGRTVLVTTQYVGEAEQCDAVLLISDGRVIAAGTPEELRRAAIGGDIVEVETAAPLDAGTLERWMASCGSSNGPTEIRATVADAAKTLPEIVDAITAAGGDVSSAAEALPADEIFAILVERARSQQPKTEDDAEQAA